MEWGIALARLRRWYVILGNILPLEIWMIICDSYTSLVAYFV